MSHDLPNRTKARDAFGALPPEVQALGEPLSVHPPNAAARLGARLPLAPVNPVAGRKLAAYLALGLPPAGAVFLIPYFQGTAFGMAPPVGWLVLPISGLVFGLIAAGYWWHLSRAVRDAPAAARPDPVDSLAGVILYPGALVHVRNREFTIIAWEEVCQLNPPAIAGRWRVIARDGRQIDLPGWIEDDGTAIASTVGRVTAVLLPQFLRQVQSGERVTFGSFAISGRHVYHRGKRAAWDEVTGMRILSGSMYALQIFCGGVLPWCSVDLAHAPNAEVLVELLRHVVPPRLLKAA